MNSFGRLFRVSIFGESHGEGCGILIDGSPAGIPLTEEDLLTDLSRRKSGKKGTTPRKEKDIPHIVSGVFNHKTTGAPILISFKNADKRSKDYDSLRDVPRPGHADFVARKKFDECNDYRGGGHFSGRITLGLVAAGVVAKKIISPIRVKSTLLEVGGSSDIEDAIQGAVETKDSIGGIIECVADNMPIGLGEPFFGSVEATISQMIFSIPAIKGIEFGAGFKAAKMTGSQHNDLLIDTNGTTKTNNNGGINGGISNGNPLVFRVVVKPTSSIGLPQRTINIKTGQLTDLTIEGRHDTCIALRVPVVVENATAIALADLHLQK
jgi:chorismate synthase